MSGKRGADENESSVLFQVCVLLVHSTLHLYTVIKNQKLSLFFCFLLLKNLKY